MSTSRWRRAAPSGRRLSRASKTRPSAMGSRCRDISSRRRSSSASGSSDERRSWTVTSGPGRSGRIRCVPSSRTAARSIGCRRTSAPTADSKRDGSIARPSSSTYRWAATKPSSWPESRPIQYACCISPSAKGPSGSAVASPFSRPVSAPVSGAGPAEASTWPFSASSSHHPASVGRSASSAKRISIPLRRSRPVSCMSRIESMPSSMRLSSASARSPSTSVSAAWSSSQVSTELLST